MQDRGGGEGGGNSGTRGNGEGIRFIGVGMQRWGGGERNGNSGCGRGWRRYMIYRWDVCVSGGC